MRIHSPKSVRPIDPAGISNGGGFDDGVRPLDPNPTANGGGKVGGTWDDSVRPLDPNATAKGRSTAPAKPR
jgi:hypothetical protein